MESNKPLKTSWTWDEWLQSRKAIREESKKISILPIRKPYSSSDHRLRKANNGERGPAFNKEFDS